MEKKKLHRIVGVLILIAVVIIILPLVTGKNGVPESKTLSVEASASPAVAVPEQPAAAVPGPEAAAELSPMPAAPASDQPPTVNPPAASDNPSTSPAAPTESTATEPPVSAPSFQSPDTDAAKPAAAPLPAAPAATVPPVAPPVTPNPADSAAAKKPVNLSSASASAWAVQMGHFHNHTNAVRLANRLRNAGFKAFTRQIVSRNGVVSTRVYVGPESAQASARRVFADIHAQFKLDGMVVPFETFAL